jgi:uncharacterized iron-regulated membrane protein
MRFACRPGLDTLLPGWALWTARAGVPLFRTAFRRFLFRVHLWTALAAGLFFVILAVTGSLLAFDEKIDHALHADLYRVAPAPRNLPLADILASVRRVFPSDDVVAVTMPASSRDAWQVALPSGIACVDPHTGRVLGLRPRGTAFVGVIAQIHVSLACGRMGRTAVRWIDFAALVLLLSGIQLWWPVRRIRIRPLSRSRTARRFWFDVHNSAGALSYVFLMVLVATGAVLSCEGVVVRLLDRFSRPAVHPVAAPALLTADASPLSADRALAMAKAALPGATPTRMQMPAYGGTYKIDMVLRSRLGPDATDVLTLDPYTGSILGEDSSRHASLAERVLRATAALHTGSFFGVAGRAVMALASLLVALQAWSGAMMLWKRRFA